MDQKDHKRGFKLISMLTFYKLPETDKKLIFEQTAVKAGLPAYAIEKDWRVVQTLRIIFGMEISQYPTFKGGTSLSKAWGLIERFSEDIDLVLDKSVLGVDRVNTKK
jgi:predicted nucleotidyltransferase component of viral defense system